MLFDIQFPEASDLLREMLNLLPSEERLRLAPRVDRVASHLFHPESGGGVVIFYALKEPPSMSNASVDRSGEVETPQLADARLSPGWPALALPQPGRLLLPHERQDSTFHE